VAVCEFRLITEPPPACRTGPQPTAEPFRHAGRDVPLHRHPIPCRPPMLATIELNRTRAFPCTVTSVLDSAADNRGTFRRVRAPRCGFHAGLGCNGSSAFMPPISDSERPLSAVFVGLQPLRGQGPNLVSIHGKVARLGSTVLCLAHGQAACPLPHNSQAYPLVKQTSCVESEWCWRDGWCD